MSHQIEMFPDAKNISILPSQSILDASKQAGIPHTHACGGNAKCSSCRVIILEGLENCLPRNKAEKELAEQLGFRDHIRLACQTRLQGNTKMRRPVLDEIDLELLSNEFDNSHESLGEEREVTLLFADIEGYTSMTEASLPYDVVHMLNRYYFIMGKVIQEQEGKIMDYFGDGFLAIFGLKKEKGHAADALHAGFQMQEQMEKINPYFEGLFCRRFRVRIGINTGDAIIGSIGIQGMQKLAAIGDSVNMASRIEAANKQLGTTFLISETTFQQVQELVNIKASYEIEMKGKKGKHLVYEVLKK